MTSQKTAAKETIEVTEKITNSLQSLTVISRVNKKIQYLLEYGVITRIYQYT